MSNEQRYELTDNQWERLAPHLSGKNGDVGRPCDDNRRFVNGVLWITRSGAPWRDLPEKYGKWGTVFQRYNRWSKAKRWEHIFCLIAEEEGIDLDWVAGDSTVIRAHQHAAGQKKKESDGTPSPDACLGRSRGGFSTKLHGMSDALGNPIRFILTAGQEADISHAARLVGDYRPEAFIGDKGYDADHFVAFLTQNDIESVIPPRRSRTEQREYDTNLYCDRNKIERLWNRLKHCRRIATRYDKTARNYLSFVFLASTILWLL